MAFETSRNVGPIAADGYIDLLDKMIVFMQANGWTVQRNLTNLGVTAVVTINNGGTGYTLNDTITLDTSADPNITAVSEATFNVDAVNAGVVTAISFVTSGEYTASDGGAGGVPTTGGTGTGLTIQPFWAGDAGATGEKEAILLGIGGGSDTIYVGVRTFRDLDTGAFQWAMRGFSGYTANLLWDNQPGASFELVNGGSTSESGSFIPLADVGTTIEYWWNCTSRRINGVFLVGSTYVGPWYMGFGSPFVVAGQWPYPLLISGCLNRSDTKFDSITPGISGCVDPIQTNITEGQTQVNWIDGSWQTVANGKVSGTGRISFGDIRWVAPSGYGVNVFPFSDDDWFNPGGNNGSADARSITPQSLTIAITINAAPQQQIEPTPNAAGALHVPIQSIIVFGNPSDQIVMEIDSIFWVSGSGVNSEDTLTIGADTYHIFKHGNRSEVYNFWCLRED